MRQKFLYLCFTIIIMASMTTQTYAKTVEVQALDSLSTLNPPSSIKIKLLEPLELSENLILQPETIITGDVYDVVSPKRLKRDADFSFKPVSYEYEGKINNIDEEIEASYTSQPLEKGQIAQKAALSVGNVVFKGLKMGVAAIKGAVENEQENRFKSSIHSAYEESPVSYIEKGQELEIKELDIFYLKFPNVKTNKKNKDDTHNTLEKE